MNYLQANTIEHNLGTAVCMWCLSVDSDCVVIGHYNLQKRKSRLLSQSTAELDMLRSQIKNTNVNGQFFLSLHVYIERKEIFDILGSVQVLLLPKVRPCFIPWRGKTGWPLHPHLLMSTSVGVRYPMWWVRYL